MGHKESVGRVGNATAHKKNVCAGDFFRPTTNIVILSSDKPIHVRNSRKFERVQLICEPHKPDNIN